MVSYFEWVQDLQQLFWEEEEVTRREYHILDRAFDQMVARAKTDGISNRTAAMAIGVERVRKAKLARGCFRDGSEGGPERLRYRPCRPYDVRGEVSGSTAVERTSFEAANGLTRRRLVSMTPGSLAYSRTPLISLNSC